MRFLSVFLIVTLWVALEASAQLPTQDDSANGVTVAVTPNVAADAKVWEFKVVLNTHSQDLSDDLVQTAFLVDDKGNKFKPLGWEGSASGGHHRSGVLKFAPVVPQPQAVELRIDRPGETKTRVFRWELK